MNIIKRIFFLIAIVIVIAASVAIYWPTLLYNKADRIEEAEEKIEILERAGRLYPFNDLVYYELGKAYFDLGMESFDQKEKCSTYLEKSVQNFRRSIRINPASPFSHFDLGLSQLYLSLFSPSLDESLYDEFKKAAFLAGENSQIFYEVGKVFLTRWSQITDEDRDFTIKILRQVMAKRKREQIQTLLQIWEMNINDYDVMRRILPEDPYVYRIYANFLGEKSLSLEERQDFLAQAEFLEFEKAKSEFDSGADELLYYEIKKASEHFKTCLNSLGKIKFYQNLTQQELIDYGEFNNLQKSSFLTLAKCLLEEGAELKDVEGDLRRYLALEDSVAGANELKSYLVERGLIDEKLEETFGDLDRLSFKLYLYFKQNRYREIMRIGRLLQESFFAVPKGKREQYVRILQLLGDSYQKIDYIYDAGEFYQKALEIDPENLEALVRLRQNYERLNADEKIREVQGRIEKLISPEDRVFRNLTINKDQSFSHTLILDGRKILLNLRFRGSREEIAPLISVLFKGRVVWEDYLKDNVLSIPLESRVGKNLLEIVAVNRGVSLVKLDYK